MTANLLALQLNADFRPTSLFPLSTVDWKQAVKLHFEGLADIVAEYPDAEIRSPSITMKVPSVIALKKFVPPQSIVVFSRRNIFLRDAYRCQYCGNRFPSEELTFDHVHPRSQGGPTNWENIATACSDCNSKKDAQHLKPLRMPYKPTARELLSAQREFLPKHIPESWRDYIYWTGELEAG